MAKPVDQFRASDITFWGVFALVSWAIALLGANLSGIVPDSVMGGLHASRLEGASLNQLRGQVAALETESARIKQENTVLLQRFVLNEQVSGDVTRRVGALELTLPRIMEAVNGGGSAGIDTSTTASTGNSPITSFDVEGGSVSYSTSPMAARKATNVASANQPMPDELGSVLPDSGAYGIALGPPIDSDEGEGAWQTMNDRVGALLLGLGPLLAPVEGGAGKRLVAGPISTEAEARQICGRMAKVGIACASVLFIGDPLPLTN